MPSCWAATCASRSAACAGGEPVYQAMPMLRDASGGAREQLDPLLGQAGVHGAQPGDVAARPGEGFDEPEADRIGDGSDDDRDGARGHLGREGRFGPGDDDNIGMESDQLGGQSSGADPIPRSGSGPQR